MRILHDIASLLQLAYQSFDYSPRKASVTKILVERFK